MAKQNLTQLGTLIRQQRQAKRLTLRALSERTGVDYTLINRAERGERRLQPHDLQQLARALNVDIEDFYALAGYLLPEGLPTFAPYLRAKYDLPEQAVAQLDEHFRRLREKQGVGDGEGR